MNIAQLLCRSARSFPHRPALTWRGETIDYRELDRRVASVADWLSANGAGRGGRVVLMMDNRPELLMAMFAAFRAGAAVVPCNARLTAEELRFIIDDARAAVVFTDAIHEGVVREASTSTQVCVVDDELGAMAAGSAALRVDTAPVDTAPDELAWIFYTSGTTGRPKGAMLTHGVLNFVTVSWLADLTPMTEHDVTMHCAPLSHGAGFHALAAVARGAHQVITDSPSFDPVAVMQTVARYRVTNTWMVPTQIVMMTDAAAGTGETAETADIASLQYVVYGGAPIAPAAMQRALDRFGPIFVQLYGQGETPMTATVLRRDEHGPETFGAAGRARVGIEVAIFDGDDRPVPEGDVGEVVVRGPSVMAGYLDRPEATAETLRNGWLHTGDLGRMRSDGIVQLLDRTKDMIISGGSNVYAVEVEQVLSGHPTVDDVAVIGLADELWGEVVTAVVVSDAYDPTALDAHCRESLAGYKIPRRYVQVEALPRNAYGKVLKRELRERIGRDPVCGSESSK